jgi:hypothetical protein
MELRNIEKRFREVAAYEHSVTLTMHLTGPGDY